MFLETIGSCRRVPDGVNVEFGEFVSQAVAFVIGGY
jgi:hypothetical protein